MNSRRLFPLFTLVLLFVLSFGFSAFAEEGYGPGSTGWHQTSDGKWEYLENGKLAKDKWITVDGVSYYMDANGYWVENATPADAGQAAVSNPSSIAAEYVNRVNPFPEYPDLVEVDIANQHVFCYKGNVLQWESYCVTGCTADGHNTPEGLFSIQSKETGRYLTGPINSKTGKPQWKNWVDYWMPFHNGCGLHDASWRNKFAGTIYQYGGSHGCVNLPVDKAPGLYSLVYVGMPVLVHP